MKPSRNSVSEALLALIQTALPNGQKFATVSRKFKDWDEISKAQRPALFLWEHGDTAAWKNEVGNYIIMNTDAIICLDPTAEPTKTPIGEIDELLDYLDEAMKPTSGYDQAQGKQTLGGLVYNARIEGEIAKASGDVTNLSVIIVPFKILVAQTTV